MKVVVTGSDGFIGRHVCKRLVNGKFDVVGLDLKTGDDILTCGLPDADWVIHLAAQTSAYCEDAEIDARANILGSIRVFQRYGDKVTFASSSMVNYPTTPYAISKRACEDYAKLYGAAIVRLCNIVGPGGHSVFEAFRGSDELTIYGSGDQRRSYADIGDAVKALLGCREGLTVVGGQDLSVNEIASRFFASKPRRYLPARAGDMMDGRQIAA